jgi:hypothetical protein
MRSGRFRSPTRSARRRTRSLATPGPSCWKRRTRSTVTLFGDRIVVEMTSMLVSIGHRYTAPDGVVHTLVDEP